MRPLNTIQNWRDLEPYGLIYLTGESCGLGMRILFDLTPAGVNLLQEFWGSNVTIQTGSNWNHSDGQVASIMLSPAIFDDLAAFTLAHEYPIVVVVNHREEGWSSHWIAGYSQEDWAEYKDRCFALYKTVRVYTNAGKMRNQHQFSGRTI